MLHVKQIECSTYPITCKTYIVLFFVCLVFLFSSSSSSFFQFAKFWTCPPMGPPLTCQVVQCPRLVPIDPCNHAAVPPTLREPVINLGPLWCGEGQWQFGRGHGGRHDVVTTIVSDSHAIRKNATKMIR